MDWKRVRKAIVAGGGAGIGAAATLLLKSGKVGAEEIGQAVVAFVVAGVPVGIATWRVPNKGQVAV